MVAFRETGAEQCRRPPGHFDGTSFYYFPLRVDHQRLKAHVKRLLSFGDQPGYHAPFGFVLLAFTHVDRLHSTDPADGAIRYKDIAIWIPVRRGDSLSIGLFPAYMFVDNASTMATGRELFGFPKQSGRFTMPIGGSWDGIFQAEVSGRRHPNDIETMMPLLTITRAADESVEEVAVQPGAFESDAESFAEIPNLLLRGLPKGTAIGLKQCRDPADPTSAMFQAITEIPIEVKNVKAMKLALRPGFLTVEKLPSHPLAADLGLDSQNVPLGLFMLADVTIDRGRTVWRAP
jgi:hypothetical protein